MQEGSIPPPVKAEARRSAKRQRYTPVACEKCKKRKIKCSGETPCRQCAKHAGTVCVYDRALPGDSTLPPSTKKTTESVVVSSTTDELVPRHPLWPLRKAEVLDLLDGFQEDVETLYPFIDLYEMKNLVEALYTSAAEPQKLQNTMQADRWDDIKEARNVDFLKLLLACALAPKESTGDDNGLNFMLTVEENNFKVVRCKSVDVKDLAMATMLSVYHYQRDNIKLAWRKIGAAARLCLEMGLHRLTDLTLDDSGAQHTPWATKMFWCIYVLDRRYSFMTNLPFTLQDRDIDFTLLQPDKSAPYLVPMVVYGRLGGRIIPTVPKFGYSSEEIDDNTKTNLGNEIDHWVEATSTSTCSSQSFSSIFPSRRLRNIYQLKVFVQIRANQMRLSLFKHSLYTAANIIKYQNFARRAVQGATENIRVLSQLQDEFDGFYESQALHYKFFLVSSLVSLYLGIRNAPHQFSGTSFEYFAGLKLLKSSMAFSPSAELTKTVMTLENAIGSLMVGTLNVYGSFLTPQFNIGMSPMSDTSNSMRDLVRDVEEIDMDWGPREHIFASPTQLNPGPLVATPPSQFSFDIQDHVGSFMHEKVQEGNSVQELAINDFTVSNCWTAPQELFWNEEGVTNGQVYWVPEFT